MKYAFGLVGLLAVVGVIVWIMGGKGGELDQAKVALDTGARLTPKVTQLSGRDANGVPANQSATLAPQITGGKLHGLLVSEIAPGGAYETHFGLKQNDLIVQIGQLDLEMIDADMAQAQLLEAFQRDQPIVVQRGGQRVTLPAPGDKPKSLQGQLEGIQHIPMH